MEKQLAGDSGLRGQNNGEALLSTQLHAAKTDKRCLNTLLHDYMPFIKKCVAGIFFKAQSREDNLPDAMLAFTHSVQTYNSEQGAFIKYAETLIRNRLIDNVRKDLVEQKRFLFFSSGSSKNTDWEAGVSFEAHYRAEEKLALRLEIEAVNQEFAKWGFSWETLLKKCPKQQRSRRKAFLIAQAVLQDSDLLALTLKTRKLPLTRLAGLYPRKILEKYRQYIAALIILLRGDYPYVYSFLPHSFSTNSFSKEEST